MYILSTGDFDGKRETGRELLAKAIDRYNADHGINMERSGAELVETIVKGEHGKPSIPGWKEFSISDTETYWAILIADTACGLDIQLSRPCRIEKIAKKYFAEEDCSVIADQGEKAFWRIWARREAAIKSVGGTVLDRIPSVSGDTVELGGKYYSICDVEIPGAPENLYAAACFCKGDGHE